MRPDDVETDVETLVDRSARALVLLLRSRSRKLTQPRLYVLVWRGQRLTGDANESAVPCRLRRGMQTMGACAYCLVGRQKKPTNVHTITRHMNALAKVI